MSIIIREYRASDLSYLKKMAAQKSIQRHTPLPTNGNEEALKQYIQERHNESCKTLVLFYEDDFVGFMSLLNTSIPETYQLAYFIDEEWQNKGIATFAVKACIPPLFLGMKCTRLQATVELENVASCRVLEKCGFTKERLMRGSAKIGGCLVDTYMYALLKP